MLKELFNWFDIHPGSYWVIASAASLLFAGWIGYSFSAVGVRVARGRHGVITGLIILATLLAWRWPPLLGPQELNPDESQLIAGAITLEHDPVFWRSVDGTTSGPLNFYALLPTHWLGIPLDFFNARLTGLLLVWGALWAGYGILRREYGNAAALLGILPGVTFFATVTDNDFIHYSSEHVSLLLIMLSAWLLWTTCRRTPGDQPLARGTWVAAGLFMGMLPWAKLQSAPIALTLALWGTWLALSRPQVPTRTRLTDLGILTAAALTPSLLFLIMVVGTGQWLHFHRSYIENNLIYASSNIEIVEGIRKMYELSTITGSFIAFMAGPLFAILIAPLVFIVNRRKPGPLYWIGCFLSVAAFVAAIAPRQGFQHYLLFLVLPLTWWMGAAMAEIHVLLGTRLKRIFLVMAFVLVTAGLSISVRAKLPPSYMFGQFLESWRNPYSDQAKIIRSLRQPGDSLAVWGWDGQIYVHSGLPQATRESHTARQLWDSPQRDVYYRPRYMEDLKAASPAFFFEAMGEDAFFFLNRYDWGHEKFPELRDYVSAHYDLVHDSRRGRLFVRRDRAPASLASPEGMTVQEP